MELRESRFGRFYGCTRFPECDGKHGAHPDGKPKGVPGDARTRAARIAAHEVFDSLWNSGEMSRTAAYRWLSLSLGRERAHIGEMSAEECAEVVLLCRQRAKKNPNGTGDELARLRLEVARLREELNRERATSKQAEQWIRECREAEAGGIEEMVRAGGGKPLGEALNRVAQRAVALACLNEAARAAGFRAARGLLEKARKDSWEAGAQRALQDVSAWLKEEASEGGRLLTVIQQVDGFPLPRYPSRTSAESDTDPNPE